MKFSHYFLTGKKLFRSKLIKFFISSLILISIAGRANAWDFDPSRDISNFTVNKVTHMVSFRMVILNNITGDNDDNLERLDVYVQGRNYFNIYCKEWYPDQYDNDCELYFTTNPEQDEEKWGIDIRDCDQVNIQIEIIGDFRYLTLTFPLQEGDLYEDTYELTTDYLEFEDEGDNYKSSGWLTLGTVSGWPPITINSITASNDNCSTININWDADGYTSDIYYRLYVDGTEIATVSGQTSYTYFMGSAEPRDYDIKLEAGYGLNLEEQMVDTTTIGGPPRTGYYPPSNFIATDHTCDKIKLYWDNSDGSCGTQTTKFFISWNGGSATVDRDVSSFEINSGIEPQTYNFTIQSINQCDFKSGASSATSNEIPLVAPTLNSVTVNPSNNTASIQWIGGNGVDHFNIVKTSALNTEVIENIDKNTFSYTDESIDGCVTYSYKVKAINKCHTDGEASNQLSTRLEPDLTNTFSSTKRLSCSKGYYNDKVVLKWDYDNTNIIDRFKIYRRDMPDGNFVLLATIDPTTSYSDETCESGVYYEYMIVGEADCESDIISTPENVYAKDVGFRIQRGIVSGNVSFEGGNGVEGVHVIAETDDQFASSSLYLSSTSSFLRIPNNNFDFSENFTFQAWVKPTSTDSRIIFQKGSQYQVLHQLNKITFVAGDQTLDLNFPEKQDTFFCVNVVRDPDSIYIYVVYDELTYYKASAQRTSATFANTSDIYIGGGGNAFTGWVDDIRIWNRSFGQKDIVNNSIMYLAGYEDGLKVYMHLDEIFYNQVFDISRQGSVFNENHGYVYNCLQSGLVPTTRQLGVKGITDSDGNYIIPNIPYTIGSIYRIVPVYDVHEFDPHMKQLYIGPGSATHNNVDFVDIAAFKITGNIRYKGTYFPVQGVNLYIDGQLVTQENGVPITTDENGDYTIYVPIGWHHISVGKYGHGFEGGGRFPEEGNWNFQAPINGVDFIDTTLIKVVGRCAGGPVEAEKKIGLGHTVNNIGNAHIVLTTQKENDLTDDPSGVSGTWDNVYYENDSAVVYGSTRYEIASTNPRYIEIYPDEETGEFVAYLLPEKYLITDITAGQYTYDDTYHTILDLTNAYRTNTEVDSIVVGTLTDIDGNVQPIYKFDSCNYQKNLELIYRVPPQLSVTNYDDNPVFWEKTFTTDSGDVIDIVNQDGSPKTNYPVFYQRGRYSLKISVFEQYVNVDNGNATDNVPVKDGIVEVQNFLAIHTTKQTYQVNDSGFVYYNWTGGLPNITTGGIGDYLLTMSITALTGNNNSIQTEWKPGGETFKAYLLGGMPTGNNFVTTGPNELITILRDPPGSNSYSYYEIGSEISKTTTHSLTKADGNDLGIEVSYGLKAKTFFGLGGGWINEVETEDDVSTGFNMTKTYIDDNTTTTTVTNTQRWETSADEDFVGSGGDVFIGYSTNIVYGINRILTFIPVGQGEGATDNEVDGYQISLKNGIRVSPEFSTTFMFSQNHIENYLIPNLIMLRNSYLINHPDVYQCVICDPNDEEFGRDNKTGEWTDEGYVGGDSYNIVIPADFPQDSTFFDSVFFYNQQIKDWLNILELNEKEKVTAQLDKNVSFDAGTVYESSVTIDTSTEVTSTYTFQYDKSLATNLGVKVNGIGAKFSYSHTWSNEKTNVDGTTETTSVTYGYVLDDGNAGDYLSIDVKKPATETGPVFITRGGQTMCPYEGRELTKYYNPGTALNEPTMQREIPQLTCEDPIAENVEEDEAAIFNFQLANVSETNDDQWFILEVDEASNQNGAQIEMDGTPIYNGRMILVPAGQTINKTITLRKVQPDVYDYENIGIILHSACQFDPTDFQEDIADTVLITAHFIPVCTSVEVVTPEDNWIVNTNTDTTLTCTVSGYDLNSSTFKMFSIQYKAASGQDWIPFMNCYTDSAEYANANEPKLFIDGQNSVEAVLDMKDMQDRNYLIKATSYCYDGTENNSEIVSGIKDVKPPKLFGSPQPADGILSPGDEVMISFDEPINAGYLERYNFSVRGVLNGSELKHETCLYFDGSNDYSSAVAGVNLDNKSWTIEFWARRGDLNPGVVFAQNGIEIGFDAGNHFYLKAGSQVITSNSTFTNTDDWTHFAVTYDYVAHSFNMFINDVIEREDVAMTSGFYGNGKMYVGRNVDGTNYFNGYVHEMRIWENALGFANIYSMMYQNLVGNEIYLAGYWPMSAAHGDVAEDKARSHHLILFGAEWRVFPTGYARTFDGNANIDFPTGSSVVLSDVNDFTIELYFKGKGQTNTVLFSNGKGDGTDQTPSFENIWLIGIDASGQIYAKNNGVIITAEGENFLDDKWHHLALVVNRQSNTNLYIDGELKAYKESSLFGGLVGANMTIGARRSQVYNSVYYDRHFIGSMDELRIWNLAKTKKQIELDMNSKLKGDEMGLLAYYPFDQYDDLGAILVPTLKDMVTDTLLASAQNGAFDNIDVPNIKDARPVKNLDFDWVVNNDKIIINIKEQPSTIEKCILEFTVQGVEDMQANRMPSPVTWTAYVKQNPVVWEDQQLYFDKEVYKEMTFQEKIVNLGGTEQNYSITGLPSWLSVDEPEGTLPPDSYKIVTFTVDPVVNIGNYDLSVFLTSDFGYDEKLNINMNVFKTPPDWNVNPDDYQYSMSVIGQLKIDGVFSTNPNDMVGAFVDGECRGVAKCQYIEDYDMYEVFLTIYSNKQSGENVTFKIWNASEGYVHINVTPELTFVYNNVIGIPSNPQVIETYNSYSFKEGLNQGWNWISFNLQNSNLSDVQYIMSGVESSDGDQIKGQSVFANYSSQYGWNGSLVDNGGFDNLSMYMLKLASADTLEYWGSKIDVTKAEIPINTGWNWIGYTPNTNMSVDDAFGNYHPANGDILKSQFEFAIYDEGLGWIGNLTYMVPGQGYMFKTSNPSGILTYPAAALSKSVAKAAKDAQTADIPWELNPTDYQFNMSIVADVILSSDISGNNALGAFVNGQCRGIAQPMQVNGQTLYFMTVYADKPEQVKFKLIDLDNKNIYNINERVTFGANEVLGDVKNPLALTIGKLATVLQDGAGSEPFTFSTYPNPFAGELIINYELSNASHVKIELFDVLGRKICTIADKDETQGSHRVIWQPVSYNGIKLNSGIYVLKIYAGNNVKTVNIIRK